MYLFAFTYAKSLKYPSHLIFMAFVIIIIIIIIIQVFRWVPPEGCKGRSRNSFFQGILEIILEYKSDTGE